MITIVSKLVTYSLLSFLAGYYVLSFVSATKRPTLTLRKKWALLSLFALTLSTTAPLFELIRALSPNFGWSEAAKLVMFSIQAGQAWWILLFFCLLLASWTAVSKTRSDTFIGLFMFFGIIFSLTLSGHPNAKASIYGSLYHALHYIGVIGWVGVLWIVALFAKDQKNWSSFLSWFSPFAMVSFSLTALSGVLLMLELLPFREYPTSWATGYGTSLLLKHLFIIPLLYYAFFNGIWMKRQIKKGVEWSVRTLIRVEAIIVTGILFATSVMSTSTPPEEVQTNPLPYAGLFQLNVVDFEWNVISSVYVMLALFLFGAAIYAVFTYRKYYISLLLSIAGVVTTYVGLLYAL